MVFDLNEYEPPIPINAEMVLNQVDDLLIYRHYIGAFNLGQKIKNPFRKDVHPSFALFFGTTSLKLMWKDFGTNESGDCFSLVSKLFGVKYYAAIEKVAIDFGIIKGAPTVTKKQIAEAKAFKEDFQKREFLIQVERRPMNQEELDYWAQYNITKQDLLDNQIFGISKIWLNKRLMRLNNTFHFAYYFPEQDKWKIYSPYDKEYKWFGNISTNQMEGLDNVKVVYIDDDMEDDMEVPAEPVIITKSRKDRIILRKLYSNVCSSQNESESAIPKEMDKIFDMAEAKYCWFDSDEPGKSANRKLNHRGYKWINVPNELYEKHGLKDPGDVIKHFGWPEGSKVLLNEMKKKGIL